MNKNSNMMLSWNKVSIKHKIVWINNHCLTESLALTHLHLVQSPPWRSVCFLYLNRKCMCSPKNQHPMETIPEVSRVHQIRFSPATQLEPGNWPGKWKNYTNIFIVHSLPVLLIGVLLNILKVTPPPRRVTQPSRLSEPIQKLELDIVCPSARSVEIP